MLRAMGLVSMFTNEHSEMYVEFKRRREVARKKYWDACNYPRKTKKKMRKEAKFDFQFYDWLSKPLTFDW